MKNAFCPTSIIYRLNYIAVWLWGLMLMVLPFSTALALTFSALAAFFSLIGIRREPLGEVLRSPIAIIALALFSWLSLSSVWSVAPRAELIEGIWKYRKLLFVILVATSLLVCQKNHRFLINFFLIGCGIVALGTLSSRFGVLEHFLGPPASSLGWPIGGTTNRSWFQIGGPENPTFGRNHITQGAFLAFASMISFGRALTSVVDSPRISPKNIFWWCAALIFMTCLFSIQGRSGYLIGTLGIAMWVIWALRCVRANLRNISIAMGVTVLSLAIFTSPHFLTRTSAAVDEVIQYSIEGKQTSQGQRILFWRAGLSLAKERPILGYGVGGYSQAFSELENAPINLRISRSQPHSEYIIQLVQGGAIAVLLFGFFLYYSLIAAMKFHSSTPPYLSIIIILFAIYVGFNSGIWDLAEGHFWAVLMGGLIGSITQQNRHLSVGQRPISV